MSQNVNHPRVGIGVIIVNSESKILVLKRQGTHAPYYSIPGGHLEMGETFEEAAVREIKEETGMDIKNPKVVALTNNLRTYREESKHYISVVLLAKEFVGEPQVLEPDKHAVMLWCDPRDLPQPHFDASEQGVKCYLENKFYL